MDTLRREEKACAKIYFTLTILIIAYFASRVVLPDNINLVKQAQESEINYSLSDY